MTRRSSRGFTLVEVMVAVVILTMGVLALLGTSRIAFASVRRATLELRAASLIEEEVEWLRTQPLDSLADGTATHPAGDTRWVVVDSTSYLRIELTVTTKSEAGVSLTDTVFVYRPR